MTFHRKKQRYLKYFNAEFLALSTYNLFFFSPKSTCSCHHGSSEEMSSDGDRFCCIVIFGIVVISYICVLRKIGKKVDIYVICFMVFMASV